MYILFVDDRPDTREVLALAFSIEGHNTRTASSGPEAVDAVREEHFDAVIMDIEMPGMNGYDTVRHIRRLEFGRAVPIIMLTAYNNSDDEEKAAECGADLLLHKPIVPRDLIARIEEVSSS